jgi:sugar (pentulose or hexulose) kinase
LSEEERLAEVERGIACLRQAAREAGVEFPDEMAVTGGQTNDELLLREKAERLGMKILRPAGGHFVHSELLGDACAAWYGLGLYSSLPDAAEHVVRQEPYENL